MQRPCTLAHEVRRRSEPRLVRDAAARQQPDCVVAEEPRHGVRGVARVRVLGQQDDQTARELLVQRREQRRQRSLGHARTRGQRVDECSDALVFDELANYGVEYRTVHDEGRNQRFRWVDGNANLSRVLCKAWVGSRVSGH